MYGCNPRILFLLYIGAAVYCPKNVASSLVCGQYECLGDSPYCCILDDGDTGCCYNTFVYQTFWFWGILVFVFFFFIGFLLQLWRTRVQRNRYMVMVQSEYPSYGTVIHNSPNQNVYPSPAYPGAAPTAAPAKPPGYVNMPPPYSN